MALPLYLATALPGLEGVLADELVAKIPAATVRETARGKVVFATPTPFDQLLTLRTADNLYRLLGRFRVGPHRTDLGDVRAAVARLDLVPGSLLSPHGVASPGRRRSHRSVTFYVNASRTGRHTYSRFELGAAAAEGVLDRHPRWRLGDPTTHDVELRLDLSGDAALFSRRLTPASFRFRGQERHFAPAALRPPVAHALVWLSDPAPGDRFVDPFCGSGTVLAERLPYPAQYLLGGDSAADVIRTTRANLRPPSLPALPDPSDLPGRDSPSGPFPTLCAGLVRWDARLLPLRDGGVDKVVTNLPFGRQVLRPTEIASLYRSFVAELRRVLAPQGTAILLTDQVDALLEVASAMHPEPLCTLSLKGLHPQIIRLRQKD